MTPPTDQPLTPAQRYQWQTDVMISGVVTEILSQNMDLFEWMLALDEEAEE